MGALVRRVGEALERGHALFAGPAAHTLGGGENSAAVVAALDRVVGAFAHLRGAGGVLPAHYRAFAAEALDALDAVRGADAELSGALSATGGADQSGWASSGAVLDGAVSDTAALNPLSHSPGGQRALIAALRARLAQQQRLVEAYQARDARLAALLGSLRYTGPATAGRGGIKLLGNGFGVPIGAGAGGRAAVSGAATVAGPVAMPGHRVRAAELAAAHDRVAGPPLGSLTRDSARHEVAAAIIHEARRRGYSPYQTTAILADALQESNLNPRAQSPNRLWYGVFQQDASYPGRHDPNLAIAVFFDRLARHGGPASADIWKSIFWLQQRPGEPSADAAFAHGRQAYLREIQAQHQRAVALYREIAG